MSLENPGASINQVESTSRKTTCSYRLFEEECIPETTYRTFDGSCNNLENPWWGTPNIPFRRLMLPIYGDGKFSPRRRSVTGFELPTAREVSNICSQQEYNLTEDGINSLFTIFAQFIAHDLSSTANGVDDDGAIVTCHCKETVKSQYCMNIPTPDMFDQVCMNFPRSSDFYKNEDSCQTRTRQQVNQVNSYLDASAIYGSDSMTANTLRTFINGQLNTSDRGLPPDRIGHDKASACLGAPDGRGCFLCGDSRANENIVLASLHMIFIRLHNRLALAFAKINRDWSDEVIYYETRRLVNAIIQHVTYEEFLPLLVGRYYSNFEGYRYDPKTDATISNEFATAAFRFGHSLVNSFFRRYDNMHRMIDEIPLSDIILNIAEAHNEDRGGLNTFVFGLLLTPTEKYDSQFNDVLRNHLFEAARVTRQVETKRLDLSAININRGRDHGLPTYNLMRHYCGLRRARSFKDLLDTINLEDVRKLAEAYDHVEDIDLYIGGLSERSVPGGLVGPTFACIIADQFSRLREGDRYFYLTKSFHIRFTSEQLTEIRRVTFSSILCQTLEGIIEIQRDAFRLPNAVDNPYLHCSLHSRLNLLFWKE